MAFRAGLLAEVVVMAFDTVRTNKMRSFLTVLGVVIGITSIVGMTALIRGFDQSLRDLIAQSGPNIIYVQKFGVVSFANGAEIRVEDNGPGIPKEIRDRLFQPFVSYGKENGTGLGLTVVQKIIQDHGGDVVVEKTSEQGTIFKLVLPLASSLSSPRSEAGSIAVPPLSRANSAERQ